LLYTYMSLFSYRPSSTTSPKPSFNMGKNTSATPTNMGSENNLGNSSSQPRLNQFDYVPKRFGLRFDPATIVVEYLVPSSGKLYHHKMKIVGLKHNSNNSDVISSLRKKHPLYFGNNKISDNQLLSLVDKLKSKLSNSEENTSSSTKPLNNIANNVFGSKISPLHTNVPSAKPTSGFSISNRSSTNSTNSGYNLGNKKEDKSGNGFWDLDDDEDKEVDYQTTNLNKLSNEALKKHKDKMDVVFMKNQKRPGDPGFVYDKQEEFKPCQANEWDDEIEEDF